jgi:hypothetical protein
MITLKILYVFSFIFFHDIFKNFFTGSLQSLTISIPIMPMQHIKNLLGRSEKISAYMQLRIRATTKNRKTNMV